MSELDIFKGIRNKTFATPKAFMDWLEEEMSWTPDLDAAASDLSAKAPRWFAGLTDDDNGLLRSWAGNVWLNPPYGSAIPTWLEKCAVEIERPEVKSIFCLLPARTDTKWFHELVIPKAWLVYLIKGRFNFEDGRHTSNAPFPSMLVVYRKKMYQPNHPFSKSGITTLDVPKEARGL